MNDEKLNLEIRKLLKRFGVTAQPKVAHAILKAIEEGKLQGHERLQVRICFEVPELGMKHEIDGELELS